MESYLYHTGLLQKWTYVGQDGRSHWSHRVGRQRNDPISGVSKNQDSVKNCLMGGKHFCICIPKNTCFFGNAQFFKIDFRIE